METKTIKELLAMDGTERTVYLLSLSDVERIMTDRKLFVAIAKKNLQTLRTNLSKRLSG